VTLDHELLKEVRSLDEFDLRRLALFVGELVASRAGTQPAAIGPSPLPTRPSRGARVTYRQQPVRCGKPACSRCAHGPYWYAYWREEGRVRSRYVGKELPAGSKG